MKITTKQIQNIIKEELDKLLYEEEDNNDLLRQALAEKLTDEDVDDYYEEIKKFIEEHYQKIQDPKALQGFKQKVLPNLDNIDTLPSFFDQFRSFVYFDEESDEEKEALKIEEFLDAEDQKSFLANIRIEAKDLSGVDLNEADLRRASLSEFNLIGANLYGADMYKAKFSKANLQGADLSYADLSRANLKEASLSKAKLHVAVLRRADLSEANLREANLSEADLKEADLSGADISGANIKWGNLYKAKLSKANLQGADLSKANLKEASLNGAILRGALYNDETQWPEGFDPVAAGAKKFNKGEQ